MTEAKTILELSEQLADKLDIGGHRRYLSDIGAILALHGELDRNPVWSGCDHSEDDAETLGDAREILREALGQWDKSLSALRTMVANEMEATIHLLREAKAPGYIEAARIRLGAIACVQQQVQDLKSFADTLLTVKAPQIGKEIAIQALVRYEAHGWVHVPAYPVPAWVQAADADKDEDTE